MYTYRSCSGHIWVEGLWAESRMASFLSSLSQPLFKRRKVEPASTTSAESSQAHAEEAGLASIFILARTFGRDHSPVIEHSWMCVFSLKRPP